MALLNGARLSVLRKNSDDVIRDVSIRTNQIKIGSEVNCTIRLKSELAEKLHCKIFAKNQKVFIANYSTKNPISVDGNVILRRAVLNDGCLIEICRTRFRWTFDTSLLQARTEKVKKAERTPTSSKFGKPRRTTIVRKKQIVDQAEPVVGSSGRKSGLKRSQKTPTYTLPKNNKQLMKNIKKRFTMHSVMVDHNSDDDEEIDDEDQDLNESAAMEVNKDLNVTTTPRKVATPEVSKNNTPFYTPDPEKENQTPATVGKTPGTPKGLSLQLENSAMMILSYTPVVGPRSKANVTKTPLSSAKKATRTGFLTPKNENITTVATTLNSPNVSKVGNSMYLIDLTTPNSKNSSYVSNRSDQSFSSSATAGLIDLTTPPSKKPKTPSSAIAKSSQKGLLRSALKNASKTPLSALRSRHTPKHVVKTLLEDSVSKSPKTPAKINRIPLTPASGSKSKTRSQVRTPVNKTIDSPAVGSPQELETPQEKGETATPKETPVMTTDELFDTLVGRQSVKKTYSRKSDSPKKLPSPLVSAEDTNELPKTDIDIWVESVVAAVTSPEPVDAESFRKMSNRTTQVRSSQYSDITPHDSFTEAPVATASEVPPTNESQEKPDPDEVSAIINDSDLEKHKKPNPAWTRRSHTPLASKIVRSLGNKRQTIGNFFTNMFGKLTVSPVTRVSITDEHHEEVTEDILDRSSEHESSEASEEEYHDSESDQQVEGTAGQSENINPSPKLRQSLRDTRKFIGNALTSLNTSKLTLDNTADVDESLLLNETYDNNSVNQSELLEENYDLTDLSARPETALPVDVSCATTLDDHSSPRKSARKVAQTDFRSEISPTNNDAQPLSAQTNRTRKSVSVCTPSARKSTRQTLNVDISPLAVPLQVTPVKESRKSVVHSPLTEQETSTCDSDEPRQSPVTAASESVLVEEKEKLPISRRSSRTIAQVSDPEESRHASNISGTGPSDVSNVDCPREVTDSATPLRSRLSKGVSRNSTVNVETQQLEPTEESIHGELNPSADVSSVDHTINTSANEVSTKILEEDTERGEAEVENDTSYANSSVVDETDQLAHLDDSKDVTSSRLSRSLNKHSPVPEHNTEQTTSDQSNSQRFTAGKTSRSRRATFSNPEPALQASDKRSTRKSLAVTVSVGSPIARQATNAKMTDESRLSLRGNRSRLNDSSVVDDLGETVTVMDEGNEVQHIVPETNSFTATSSSDMPSSKTGENEEIVEANHDSLSTSALETVDEEEQSTVSEMQDPSTPIRQGSSSLRQNRASNGVKSNDRLSASVGKPIRKAANGTPLFRKAIFAMCTPSRSSGNSDFSGSRAVTTAAATPDQQTQEVLPVGTKSKPTTPVRSTRRSTIGTKESTAAHLNSEVVAQNESTMLDAAAKIESPRKDSEQTSMPTEESPSVSSPVIHTPRRRGRTSKIETPIATPVLLAEHVPGKCVETPTSARKSKTITSVETPSADKSVSVQTVQEETHDSYVEVSTPSKEQGGELSVEVSSSLRISRSRKSTVIARQSIVNTQNESTVSEVDVKIGTPSRRSTIASGGESQLTASKKTSVVEQLAEPIVEQPGLKISTPSKNTSVITGNEAEASMLASTPEHLSPARVSRSSRRSTNAEQLSESVVEQPDASTTEIEASTPFKETFATAGNASMAAFTPEHVSPSQASRSSRRSMVVSDEAEQLSESIIEQPDVSVTEVGVSTPSKETSVLVENTVEVSTPEHISSTRASRSSRRSTIASDESQLTSRSASKRTTRVEHHSESIEQPDASTAELDVFTPSKNTSIMTVNATEASLLASTPEHVSPARASRSSRRSTIVSDKVEQLYESIVEQPDASTTEVEVSTPTKETSAMAEKAVEVSTPEHVSSTRASRSSRRLTMASAESLLTSRSASKRTTRVKQHSESIVGQPDASTVEVEVSTPSKETSVKAGNATEASLLASTPEHISPAGASRSSRRSTIVSDKVKQLSESIVEQPDASKTEVGVSTPSKETSAMAENASMAAFTPEHVSPSLVSRSSRKSTVVSDEAEQLSESIIEQPDASVTEDGDSTPSKKTSVMVEKAVEVSTSEHVSSTRASRSFRRLTMASAESLLTSRSVSKRTTREQHSESIVGQLDASTAEVEVSTPSKETTVMAGNATEASLLASTHEQVSPAPASRSSRRSTIDSDKIEQPSESIVEQPDASTTEVEVSTPSRETSVMDVNATEASMVASSPEQVGPAQVSRSSRRSTIVSDETLRISRSANKKASVVEQHSESIVEQPDASTTEVGVSTPSKEIAVMARNAAEVSLIASTPEHISPARASRSTRRSTIVSDKVDKLSVSIVEQPDAPTIEVEVPTSSKKETSVMAGNAAESSMVAVTPEHAPIPARVSRSSRKSTIASDKTVTVSRSASKKASVVDQLFESIVEQPDASTEDDVATSIKETSLMAGNAAEAYMAPTPEHISPARVSRSSRRSTIVSHESPLTSLSANKRTASESIVEQPDASSTEVDVSTPSKETAGNAAEASMVASTPERDSPARASRSTRRSAIVYHEVDQLTESVVEQPDVSTTEEQEAGNAAEASMAPTPEHTIPARPSRSSRRSTILPDKVEQLSELIVEQPDVSTTEVEVSIPCKETSLMAGYAAEVSMVASSPEHVVPARVSGSPRRSTIVSDESLMTSRSASKKTRVVEQLSESTVEQPEVSTTEVDVSTPSKETSVMARNATEVSMETVTPEHAPIPARTSRSSRRSAIVSNEVDQLAESIVELPDASTTEDDVATSIKETSLMAVNAAEASMTPTPEHINPARASRSSRRSTIVPDKVEQLSELIVEQPEASTTEVGVSTPSKNTSVVSRSSRRSTIVSDETLLSSRSASKRRPEAEQLSESTVEQPNASITELAVSTPFEETSVMGENAAKASLVASTPEHISPARKSRTSRKSTIGTAASKLVDRAAESGASNELTETLYSSPKQPEVSTENMQTSVADSPSVIRTPRIRSSAKKIETPAVATPVAVDHLTSASIRKSLLINRSASKRTTVVEQISESIIEPDDRTPSKESSVISENVAELEQSIKIRSPVRVTAAKESTPARQSVVDVELGSQSKTAVVNVTQSIQSPKQVSMLSPKSATVASPVPDTSLTRRRTSKFGSPFATPADLTNGIPISLRNSLLTTCTEQVHDSAIEQQGASITEPELTTPSKETVRASRSTRRSMINVKESNKSDVNAQLHASPQPLPIQSEQELSEDVKESSTLQMEHTPRTRGRLSKTATPASVVKEGSKTPAAVRDVTIPKHELLTPIKAPSTVESTPELILPSRDVGCVSTPALDTIFKTPRPIRGTRTTPLSAMKRTPASATKDQQMLKSVASGIPVQQTRLSRKSTHEVDAGDHQVPCSPQIQTDEPSMDHDNRDRRSTRLSTSINFNAESSPSSSSMVAGLADSSMTVTDANISATPFVIEETPSKSVAPSVSKTDVSGNTRSVDVCPDLLKHLCERVITLEHELETLDEDSAENVSSSVNVQQSLDESAANCTDSLFGIQKLLETPIATSTIRKKLRSSTVPLMEADETSHLEGVEQLLKTPIEKKLLQSSEALTAVTANSKFDGTTPDSTGNLDGIQKLMETPVALAGRRKKLQKSPAIDLSDSTLNTTTNLEGVDQLLKTPAASSAMKSKVTSMTPDASMQLEGIHELLQTPVAVPDASDEEQESSPVAKEVSQRRVTRRNLRTSVSSVNSSGHLEGIQRLLETPVASAVVPSEFSSEDDQQLTRTPVATTVKKILESLAQSSSSSDGAERVIQTPNTANLKKVEDLLRTPVEDGSNLEGVELIFKTPSAPLSARKTQRSTAKASRTKLDESSNFEGMQQMLQTPVNKEKLLRSPANDSAVDSTINLEGLEQLLKSPVASTPASSGVRKSLRTSTAVKLDLIDQDSSHMEGVQELLQSPATAFIFPKKRSDVTLNNSVNLEGVRLLLQTPDDASVGKKGDSDESINTAFISPKKRSFVMLNNSVNLEEGLRLLQTPDDTSVSKKVDADKSICLESVQQLFKTPNPSSVVKRKGRSAAATTAVINRCNLDDSDALEGVQSLLKTPEMSSTSRKQPSGRARLAKLNDTPLNDTVNMEGLQQLLETPVDAEKKQESASTKNEDTVILYGFQKLVDTTASSLGNESEQHNDSTINLEGLQSLLSTPMGTTEPKSSTLADDGSQSTPVAVVANESMNLEGIQQMLETPVVAATGKNLLKRALVNRIRGTPANTSMNLEGIQQLLATPSVESSTNSQKPSEDSPNDRHLEDVQQLTQVNASVKVDVSVSDSVAEVSTPTNTRLRRKLYTKNDPEDKTPESVKSSEVHRVTSDDYLNILEPKLGKKPTESDQASKNAEPSVDEPIRKNPSRASKKNKSLAEEALAGASPELKYVKPKQPKIVEEPSPVTPIEEPASTSPTADSGSPDLSAGRRKVMFNENLQIKEINSPAIVGDIIQKVYRGRGRKAQKEVRVIVAEPSEQLAIKPARRATKPDAEKEESNNADEQPADADDTAAKRPRRGAKRVIDAVEVPSDSNNSQPEGTVNSTGDGANEEAKVATAPEESDKSEVEPVVKRARGATAKSKPEAKKTSTRTRAKKLDTVPVPDVEVLPNEATVSAEQVESTASQEHSEATSILTPEQSQRDTSEIIVDPTSPVEPTQDVQIVPEPVFKAPEDEQVVEPVSGRGKRGAKKTATRTTRTKLSKKKVTEEDSTTDAQPVVESVEPNTAQEPTVARNTIELEPAEPLEEKPAPKRTQRATTAKSRQRRAAATKTETSDAEPSSASTQIQEEHTLDKPPAEATDEHTVVESSTAQESTVTTNAVESEASASTAEPKEEKAAPKRTKRVPAAAKGRQRRGVATKTGTSDAESSSVQVPQVQDDKPILRTPTVEAPVVEQAAADSTSHDEPEPIPAKRARGRTTRKPPAKATDAPVIAVIEEASPMPPPPPVTDILPQIDEHSSDKLPSKRAPARKGGRKKPLAQEELHPEVHTTEESLNESHMVRTMLPSTHTSTPLPQIEEEKPKPRRGRAKKAVNPTVAALIVEESTPNRRSPRSGRADSESRTHDSQNTVTDAEEPKTKRSRTRTVAKMNLNDDSKDHPPTEDNSSTAVEKPTDDKKPSRAPAKRGRGKTEPEPAAVVEEVAPKRVRKLPAKLQDHADVPSSNDTDTETGKEEPVVILSSRGRRAATKTTKPVESNDKTNDESNDVVEKKSSKSRKPAAKRPAATRKKAAHVEQDEEQDAEDEASQDAKKIQKDEEPAAAESTGSAPATTGRRRPLRSRK